MADTRHPGERSTEESRATPVHDESCVAGCELHDGLCASPGRLGWEDRRREKPPLESEIATRPPAAQRRCAPRSLPARLRAAMTSRTPRSIARSASTRSRGGVVAGVAVASCICTSISTCDCDGGEGGGVGVGGAAAEAGATGALAGIGAVGRGAEPVACSAKVLMLL